LTVRAFQLRGQAKLPESNLYHVIGPDDYLREEALHRIKRELLDADFGDFNYRSLRCTANLKLSLLQDALAELPVMVDRRLLELQNPGALSPKGWEAVAEAYARSSKVGDLILVLAWEGAPKKGGGGAKKKTESAPADARLVEQGVKITCEVDDKERPQWVRARAQELGLKTEEGTLETLLARTGSDLRLLDSHLEKLRLYCGAEESCPKKLVEELVPVSSEVQTWRFTSAIGRKSVNEAYSVLDQLLGRGEPAGSLLSYLNTYLVGLAQLLHLRQELKTAAAIAAALPRKTEFQVKKNLEEANSFSPPELRAAFERIERADFRIKTGADPRLMLQLLVLQLCTRKGGGN
jgi:DNA polymerase III delta subunit